MSLNKVMLIGNVGKDPDVRYLDNIFSGNKSCSGIHAFSCFVDRFTGHLVVGSYRLGTGGSCWSYLLSPLQKKFTAYGIINQMLITITHKKSIVLFIIQWIFCYIKSLLLFL